MMNCYGVRSVTSRSAARGFFSLFYYWSTARHLASKNLQVFRHSATEQWSPLASLRTLHCSTMHRQSQDTTTISTSSAEPVLSSRLRDIMRKMSHSVVVVTASSGVDDSPLSFKGMTVSSFTTLTLTPTPIVTFNIRKPSQTLEALRNTREFIIHILSATEAGAIVADTFTRGNDANVFRSAAFEVLRARGISPPLLSGHGIIKVLRCRLREGPADGLIDIGDHVLVLGDVIGIIEPPTGEDAYGEERGLCYLDREYRKVGEVIKIGSRRGGH